MNISGILTVIVSPVVLWAGSSIVSHDRYIAADKKEKENLISELKNMSQDIRDIRNILMRSRNDRESDTVKAKK